MVSHKSKIFLITSITLVLLIYLGSSFVNAHGGDENSKAIEGELVTLTGTISSIDDHGFTLSTVDGDVFIPIPYYLDRTVFNLEINSEATVIGYYVTHSMMIVFSEQMFHSESINGITIEYGEEDCDSSQHGEMGGHMGSGMGM